MESIVIEIHINERYLIVTTNGCREYLLSINGLGLKSVECVRLLSLHQIAFPVSQ
jgi:3-methyladenine DNA glycosylase/8-oxoguanine DNA glycosylase